MNDLKAHIALFVVAAVAAVLTWTRDTVDREDIGRPVVWDRDTADVLGVDYRNPVLDLQVLRRSDDDGAFLWGIETRGGEAPMEFPVGVEGHELLKALAVLRVERDLGELSPSQREQYGLADPEGHLTVRFAEGPRELVVGDSVFGSGDRYAMEIASGSGYVLSRNLVTGLEYGAGRVQERFVHHFADSDVGAVRISGPDGERRMARTESGEWTEMDGGSPDAGFGNFMERVGMLAMEGYDNSPPPQTLTLILRVDYVSADAEPLGFVELLHDGAEPFKTYYLGSETTRILGRVPRILAERVEQAVGDVF